MYTGLCNKMYMLLILPYKQKIIYSFLVKIRLVGLAHQKIKLPSPGKHETQKLKRDQLLKLLIPQFLILAVSAVFRRFSSRFYFVFFKTVKTALRLHLSTKRLLDPRRSWKGPMNSALSVRPSVRNAVFSELTH